MPRWWISTLLLAALSTAPSPVRAQDTERARALFLEAQTAFERGQLAEAQDLLERSLRAAPRPPTAINLALVQQRIGATVDAAQTLTDLLAGAYGEVSERSRAQASTLLEEVRASIAHVELEVTGSGATAVELDGARVDQLEAPATRSLPVDAGEHVVAVVPADGERQARNVDLSAGETVPVRFELDVGPTRGGGSPEGGSVVDSSWFWFVGALILLAGAAAAVTIWWFVDGQPSGPAADPVWGEAQPLLRF